MCSFVEKKKLYFIIIALVLYFIIIPNYSWAEEYREADIGIKKTGSMYYLGQINFKGYQTLKKIYTNSNEKVKNTNLLIINSSGGDLWAGLMIGNFIKDNNIDIIIPHFCLSSCANYIFPAARNKFLEENAIVGFHETKIKLNIRHKKNGPASSINIAKTQHNESKLKNVNYIPTECQYNSNLLVDSTQKKEIYEYTIKLCSKYRKNQIKTFYEKLNVDFRLPKIGIKKLKLSQKENGSIVGLFYYDKASLKALGLKHVRFHKNWDPSKNPLFKNTIEVKRSDWE